ncbi:MAG: hypothetical protein ACUVUE_00675 [Candidatus Bathycorpusculaceae bacterium]
MKFKAEISLLLFAIVLYSVSAFCYSYGDCSERMAFALNYPYRDYAFPLVGFALALVAAAAFSYSRRSKVLRRKKEACKTKEYS